MKKILAILLTTTMLTACANNKYTEDDTHKKEVIGTIIGATAGGLGGARVGKGRGRSAAILGGILIGGYIGNRTGATFDEVDNMTAAHNARVALENAPDNTITAWNNPNKNVGGTFTPTNTTVTNGQPCREYYSTVHIGPDEQTVYGKACRQVDSSWKIVQ